MGKVLNSNVMRRLAAPAPGGAKRDYIPFVPENQNIQAIQAQLRGVAFRNDWTRVVIPGDDCGCGGTKSASSIKQAQARREQQFRKEASYARFSTFMETPTDNQRLNNPAQQSFVQQRQLTIPNTQRQFYAFMHAVSAAFGSLEQ